VPDSFGRPGGTLLRVAIHGPNEGRAHSAYTFRHPPGEGGEEIGRMLDGPPQPWVSVTATVSYSQDAHPWFFHMRPSQAAAPGEGGEHDRGGALARRAADTILLSELRRDGGPALAECVVTAMGVIDGQIALIAAQLQRVRDLGVHDYASAVSFVRRLTSVHDYRDAVLALMSVMPPRSEDPHSPLSQAPNAAGRGVFASAVWTLRSWIERTQPAAVQLGALFPFHEDGYPVDSYSLEVRSRRAIRSNHPLRVQVRFDALVGHWGHFGGRWRGNEVPPQGEWRLHLYSAIPVTTQALVQPIVGWIKEHYPDARVLISNEGGWRYGAYGQNENWREA
jgi:hypothetical protein